MGYGGTGTLRQNRLPKECPIAKVDTMKKRARGSYEFACQVPRPNLIAIYNQYMGGTDLMDAHVNNYRIGIRGKKWWWPIFTWLIDVSLNNAWILTRKSGRNISQLDFRREIAQTYLKKYGSPPKNGGRPSSARVLTGMRYDGENHFPKSIVNKRRCADENCKTIGRMECTKCNVGLCIKCFQTYHTK
ncbi:unnamed protein product [Euphydryas editha]|uniref:PiggyBac transposable element-derived protein domain-containing protein n=1 Tax=Euphydryas editha TaxID=104508 RepID=A0AAU9TLP5_EUPED|nr:unnamed protein product [Euphydryas editha]